MDACAVSDAAAKKDGDDFGKLLVAGSNNFELLLDNHYGPKGDRKCAAPAFLDELAAYEKSQLGRSDVTLLPAPVPPEQGQFSSPYTARDGSTQGYVIEMTNVYANDAVVALKAGALTAPVNTFLSHHVNGKDVDAFQSEFERRKGSLPYKATVIGTDVIIEDANS